MSTPVEQIKERLSIEDVVGTYVKLERAGKSLKAKCPFHNEKTASFYVSPDRGGYFCFGCGAKGDIFSFVEQFEGLDFMGALKLLAERAGVDISRGKNGQGGGGFYGADFAKSRSEKDRLYAVMEDAAIFFEDNLAGKNPLIQDNTIYSMAAAEAREYVKRRGIHETTVKEFRIGFVPSEWRLLYNHLRAKDFSDIEIEKAGLGKRPEANDTAGGSGNVSAGAVGGNSSPAKSLYDRFRDRIMFPIFDSSGRVIAFSGRIIHENIVGKNGQPAIAAAKYLNSPDTPLYNKSTVLYGIDKAKQAIRERGYTILVEGQMDLVLSHQAGIKNTVAVSGTALADTLTSASRDASGNISREGVVNNLGIVRRLSPNLILAFDSDAAGRKAAMRSAEIGLSLGMDVKIADLPEGKDPADMVLADPESWKDVLRKAKPVVEFQLDHVLTEVSAKKLDARKIPPLLRERIYPFIAILANQTDQAHYVKMVRERALGNAENEAIIWEDINKVRKASLASQLTPMAGGALDSSRQATPANGTLSAGAEMSRLDVISRKLFGFLAYLGQGDDHIVDVDGYYSAIKKIAGDERYHNLIQKIETSKDELIFEAEIFFGSREESKKKPDAVKKSLDELVLNFEEDILRQDFAIAMIELANLERKKGTVQGVQGKEQKEGEDVVHTSETIELLKKCQTLSVRIAEIARLRNSF